ISAEIGAIMDAAMNDPTVTADVEAITAYAEAKGLSWNDAFLQFLRDPNAAERAGGQAGA
ncbi:MAG TPA: hypothetical protein VHB27_04080, partial [Rhodopila sp.]|uniref:hypothetical protein n=1 Tax=Rhodopila sp. TaxID=2480087 RepID=UPI002C268ACC